MKPRVSILMVTSIDGRLHPSRFTASPEGTRQDWSKEYEAVHASLQADAWLVGRVTMAEISKAGPHPPGPPFNVTRRVHNAAGTARSFAITLDPSGKNHFGSRTLSGDHVIALLGPTVPDSHLAELAADGVSYIVSQKAEIDLAESLDVLAREFGIRHLVVEGGAATNGAFLAAGVVDELLLLIAPALDGGEHVQGIVAYGDGLAGKMRMKLKSAAVLGHGVVQLSYAVLPPG